jgi:asparagine synthase (glutamine-hydrolysing)
VGDIAANCLPAGLKGRHYAIGFAADLDYSIAHVNLYFDSVMRRHLLTPNGLKESKLEVSPEAFRASLCQPEHSPLQQATRADFQTTLVDAYLVKVDRASMLTSLEVRAPFLDHRIIEFAFGRVPDSERATQKDRKVLLRRLAKRLLPPELDLKRKQGFSMPLNTWFKGDWGRFVESVLSEADPTLFNKDLIHKLITNQRRGFSNTNRLFALTMFELWRREYRVTLPN